MNSIGIVFEDDDEFGNLDTCLTSADVAGTDKDMEGDWFDNLDLSHLSTTEEHQLRNLLRKYDKVFDDRPGTCNVSYHEIKLVEGFVPKQLYPYRIPEKLRDEDDRQITELLAQGKIRESDSPFAHPLVCVVKKYNSDRPAKDLRYVNSGTICDSYTIPRVENVLRRV